MAKPQEGPWLSGGLNVERLSFPNSFYQLLQVGLGNFSGNWIPCLSWLRLAQSSSHFHPECMKGTAPLSPGLGQVRLCPAWGAGGGRQVGSTWSYTLSPFTSVSTTADFKEHGQMSVSVEACLPLKNSLARFP